MKFEANWKNRSLDSLEKTDWGLPAYSSYLVTAVHRLRKVPLNEFKIEDLRIMIGQNIGLNFLIPLAIEKLSENLFAEGGFYEGDLLQVVLNSDSGFWHFNPDLWNLVNNLIKDRTQELSAENINYTAFKSLNIGS